MALATYQDLCIDATTPCSLGAFWAAVLGLELHRHADGDVHLTGPTAAAHRLGQPGAGAQDRQAPACTSTSTSPRWRSSRPSGATVLDADSFRWTLMADPEGGEFCAFVREGEITQRLYEIGVDTADSPEAAHRIATWWADVLGAQVDRRRTGHAYVVSIPGAPFESIVFCPVPEPKTVKNRIHLDVTTPTSDALVDAGATVLRAAGRRHRLDGDGRPRRQRVLRVPGRLGNSLTRACAAAWRRWRA